MKSFACGQSTSDLMEIATFKRMKLKGRLYLKFSKIDILGGLNEEEG